MPQAILGIVAVLGIIGAYLVQANSLFCRTDLCKEAERQRQYQVKVEHAFGMDRAREEAGDRFNMEKESRTAANTALVNDSEARKIEAKAKVDREHELQMARIQADRDAKAQANALALARVQDRFRVVERPREQFNVIHYMQARGMGQAPRKRCCVQRQPRYETVLRTGYPGQYRMPRR